MVGQHALWTIISAADDSVAMPKDSIQGEMLNVRAGGSDCGTFTLANITQ